MGNKTHKQKLSQEDLEFLKNHTRYNKSDIKQWFKYFKQECPDGKMTKSQFLERYKRNFSSGDAEKFCDHVFRTYDTDKNGYIDFKEFLLANNVATAGSPKERLKLAFKMYDVDGNGVIDMDEMTKIIQAIYDMIGSFNVGVCIPQDCAVVRAQDIFQKMDEDQDGRLTQEEFLRGCLQDDELSEILTAAR